MLIFLLVCLPHGTIVVFVLAYQQLLHYKLQELYIIRAAYFHYLYEVRLPPFTAIDRTFKPIYQY